MKEISVDTFSEVMGVAPRKVREALYSRYNIKTKSSGLLSALKGKKEERTKKLHDSLKAAQAPRELEFLKELFRNWLFHQRPMLKDTLDFLEVKNDNGLVEVETDFFKNLNEKKVSELISHLTSKYPKDAIRIYFTFMEVPHFHRYL